MPNLKEAIQAFKDKSKPLDWRKTLIDAGEAEIQKFLIQVEQEIRSEMSTRVEKVISDLFNENLVKFEGEQGEVGEIGEIGPIGPRGEKGDQGISGQNGKDGRDGRDGIDGKNADTTEITKLVIAQLPIDEEEKPEETARALETLSGDKRLDISAIKGLDKQLQNITKSVQSSSKGKQGGGMGNAVHQSFSLTSATTSVILAQKIAANGYALWPYYEGALLVRGVGYTVANDHKTLNLLFTPEDGTNLDTIAIRT